MEFLDSESMQFQNSQKVLYTCIHINLRSIFPQHISFMGGLWDGLAQPPTSINHQPLSTGKYWCEAKDPALVDRAKCFIHGLIRTPCFGNPNCFGSEVRDARIPWTTTHPDAAGVQSECEIFWFWGEEWIMIDHVLFNLLDSFILTSTSLGGVWFKMGILYLAVNSCRVQSCHDLKR